MEIMQHYLKMRIKSNLILILNKILKIASFFNHSFNCLEKAIVALVCLLFL